MDEHFEALTDDQRDAIQAGLLVSVTAEDASFIRRIIAQNADLRSRLATAERVVDELSARPNWTAYRALQNERAGAASERAARYEAALVDCLRVLDALEFNGVPGSVAFADQHAALTAHDQEEK